MRQRRVWALGMVAVVSGLLAGCGGGGGVAGAVRLTVTPETATVGTCDSLQLTATVTGTANTAVTCAVQEAGGGSVTAGGMYTAPVTFGVYHVVMTSVADPTVSQVVTITVNYTGAPQIEFTSVPALGSTADLQGRVMNVAPAAFNVAVFVRSSSSQGWFNKPLWSDRLTPINADGTWTCDVTTGPGDESAPLIAAYLVPNGYMPPRVEDDRNIPDEVIQNAVASVTIQR